MAMLLRPAKRKTKQNKEIENDYLENEQKEPLEPDKGELNSIIDSLDSLTASLDSASASKDEILKYDQRNPFEPDEGKLNSIIASLITTALDSQIASKGRKKAFLSHVSPLGDIRLTEEQKRQYLNFEKVSNHKWPNSTIPYKIQESDYSPEQLEIISDAISEFNQANLHLVPYNETKHKDFVYVFSGKGCWSYLGRIGGKQDLSLQSNGGVNKRTVLHEFMHAAGLDHEHNRSDRDNYVKVLWDNIEKKWHSEYEKVLGSDFEQGKYDYYSVMHYPHWASHDGWKPGKDAFKIKDTSVDKNRLGEGKDGKKGLTEMDLIKLNSFYPK